MTYFIARIVRVLKWIPVIWKTHTWDYGYTLIILKRSLEDLYNCIDEYGVHVNKHRELKRMKVTLLLLDRIIKDDYYMQEPFFDNEKHKFECMVSRERLDEELLYKYLWKYGSGWWD